MFKKFFNTIDRTLAENSGKRPFSDYAEIVGKINKFSFNNFSENQFTDHIRQFRERFSVWLSGAQNEYAEESRNRVKLSYPAFLNAFMQKDSFISDFLIESYAITKEICSRVLKLEPFDSQLLTGVALHFGNIAELPTGEGKTLAAVFPVSVNALTGMGVHVFTFNDYLAKRDALWMKDIYEAWGLSVDCIQERMDNTRRKVSYQADITYLTPKEAGFDYLRDSMAYSEDELVHRPFNFAIVDEADSILIDEARVPMIIAGDMPDSQVPMGRSLVEIVSGLRPGRDYLTDGNQRNVYLTDDGISRLERVLSCGNLYDAGNLGLLTSINNLLHAKTLLKKDVDYIVRDEKVEIIDEFTGRIADRRKWHDGLQMAVEALEGLNNVRNSRILGRITLQNFISLYPKISGMTATARTSRDEFRETYSLEVFVAEPYKKCIRIDYPDLVFTHREAKFAAIAADIILTHETGRPILIGTANIEESEMLEKRLKKHGISCVVLNAKNDDEEAGIIAQAGRLGAVTVSTNMAGRGVDIKLGDRGNPDETDEVIKLGGLYVIGTSRNECVRIDNQLRGRAGRQGDPGASIFYVSLEDELLTRYGIYDELPPKYNGLKKAEKINDNKLNQLIGHIQRVVDGQNFEIRRTLGKYAYVLECQRRILFARRTDILLKRTPSASELKEPEKYIELCAFHGKEKVDEIGRRVSLNCIDESWYDFLECCEDIREGIHLVSAGRKNPLDEYHKLVIEEFDRLYRGLDVKILCEMDKVDFTRDMETLIQERNNRPSSTWTYIINDSVKVKRFSLFAGRDI